MNWNGFNEIDPELTRASSSQRQRWIYIDKGRNDPEIVYLPLFRETMGLVAIDLPTRILPVPVAVYKLDKKWSKNRPVDCYIYCGDDFR